MFRPHICGDTCRSSREGTLASNYDFPWGQRGHLFGHGLSTAGWDVPCWWNKRWIFTSHDNDNIGPQYRMTPMLLLLVIPLPFCLNHVSSFFWGQVKAQFSMVQRVGSQPGWSLYRLSLQPAQNIGWPGSMDWLKMVCSSQWIDWRENLQVFKGHVSSCVF